jgi:ABC-type glutathione transport system ATPase component
LTRTGAAATATITATQEAKDFKVVVTLDNPPPELRPGLSATASIVTATRQHVLTVPIQALTIREFDADSNAPASADATKKDSSEKARKKVEKEGVFTIKESVASFREVKTGITGTTELEVENGLSENEEIVTGPYQVLRTLKDNTRIKIEKGGRKMTRAQDGMIQTIDLWKTYEMGNNAVHALQGVTFSIARNEYVAIMGPSGSGKSTLMNLIGCLDTPTKGEYYLNGRLVSQMDDDELAHIRNKEIGFRFPDVQSSRASYRAA